MCYPSAGVFCSLQLVCKFTIIRIRDYSVVCPGGGLFQGARPALPGRAPGHASLHAALPMHELVFVAQAPRLEDLLVDTLRG